MQYAVPRMCSEYSPKAPARFRPQGGSGQGALLKFKGENVLLKYLPFGHTRDKILTLL